MCIHLHSFKYTQVHIYVLMRRGNVPVAANEDDRVAVCCSVCCIVCCTDASRQCSGGSKVKIKFLLTMQLTLEKFVHDFAATSKLTLSYAKTIELTCEDF